MARGYFGVPKNKLFQLKSENLPGILSQLQMAGLQDAFIKFDMTSDDFSLTVNGMSIIRTYTNQLNTFPSKLEDSQVKEKLGKARNEYSEDKVAQLLNYSPDIDYRLPVLTTTKKYESVPTGYYIFSQVMGLDREDIQMQFGKQCRELDDKSFSSLKYEITRNLCKDFGVEYPEEVDRGSESGVNYKSIFNETQQALLPLREYFEKRNIDGHTRDEMEDYIARKYKPDDTQRLNDNTQKIANIFSDLFKARRANILTPTGDGLVVFFKQVTDRVFGETTNPLHMIMVTCPRYNEDEGLSETAGAYLSGLPRLTSVLTKHGILYEGHILVDDAEERVAGGAYLSRLGLTNKSYIVECDRNVKAIRRAVAKDDRLANVSVQPFGDMFPDFVDTAADLERHLFRLTKIDLDLRLSMAEIAQTRLARHTKILGGICDFSDSLYLSIHYSAEYMVLGYLCRLYPELSRDSFIVNYNSPNVEQFNNVDLLARCIQENALSNGLISVPVFQVKLY